MTDLTSQFMTSAPVDPEEVAFERKRSIARATDAAGEESPFAAMLGPIGQRVFTGYVKTAVQTMGMTNRMVAGLAEAALQVYNTVGSAIDVVAEAVVGEQPSQTTMADLVTGQKKPPAPATPTPVSAVPASTTAPAPLAGPTWNDAPIKDALTRLRDEARAEAGRQGVGEDSLAGNLTEGTVQFMVPFSMALKAMGGLQAGATAANIAKGAAAEAVTMFGAFDPHAGRFADLVRAVSPDGLASNRYIDYLTNRENEGEFEGRFKNVVDSLSGSAAVAGALKVGGTTLRAAHLAATTPAPTKLQAQRGSIDLRKLSPEQAAIAERSRNLWSSGSTPELVPQLLGPDNTPLTEYFARNPEVKTFVDQNPGIVSTRLPTAINATENKNSGNLLIDYSVAKSDPTTFNKNIGMMSQYPNFKIDEGMSPDQQSEQMIDQMKSNLLFVHDIMPQNYRDRSHLWYVGARNIVDSWAPKYELPDQAISGVLAVLSPQKDWFQNVSLAERVLDISRNQRDFSWNSKMDAKASEIWDEKYAPVLNLVRNKTFGELTSPRHKALWLRTYDQAFNSPNHLVVSPEGNFEGMRLTDSGRRRKIAWGSLNEIGKAIAIVDNPEVANISTLLGDKHKVRSFYSNIYAPFDPRGAATIDTHAVAAAMLRPLSGKSREVLHNFGSGIAGEGGPGKNSLLGLNGTYGIILEAYRRAAAERGLLPRELQSITWEGVRGLFPDKWKKRQNAASIDAIWNRYRNGQMTLQEAQNEVIQASPNKGTGTPEWARSAK
jgi:hypothetical protein